MFNENIEKIIIIFTIALGILVVGIQIGIHHGRELEKQEYYEYISTD